MDRKRPAEMAAPRSAFVRAHGPDPSTIRIDLPGPGRAMVAGPHAQATHLETSLPEDLRSAMTPLTEAIREAASVDDAAQRMMALLTRHGRTVDRRDEPRVSIRRHPAGRFHPHHRWPLVDAELLGLTHGQRAVAKRMCPPGGASDRAERFRALGFAATWFGVTTHGAGAQQREVILVARDASALEEARRVEDALVRSADARIDDAESVRAMGALLGYPRCCVERFVRMRARDDASLAGALLGPIDEPMPFETSFTIPPFTLISHAPCHPQCASTIAQVRALLALMPAESRDGYARLADAHWGVDDEGLLVRTPRATPSQSVRIDPSDPELPEEGTVTPPPAALHWRVRFTTMS